ncbi:hypothetical protein NLG97_g2518 [Lecanicillium saksenae]|uniref:Uncharacterized protein n=1 Tax=Lecanicillium saksenae TaxID=468837 RepID=A0ACC1R1Y4_9HYPO|nr:hypothetical protein NLG97_g2518 [Lecanicillium saksenae]
MSAFDSLGIVANVFAVVDLSTKVIGLCAQYARDVKNKDNDKARLLCEVTALYYVCDKVKTVLDSPQGGQLKVSRELPGVMAMSQALLRQLYSKLATDPSQFGARQVLTTLHWPLQKKDVERIIRELRQCKEMARLALQVDQTNIMIKVDRDAVLNRLPIVVGAAFDSKAAEHSPHCLPETRVEILQSIATWAHDPTTKSIFWLNGKAGTGKSTISRTVAQNFSNTGCLKGSFFFKRGEGDRSSLSRFFTTLAADLIIREPGTAYFIKEELDSDPSIIHKTAREQFEKLFYGPLAKVATLRTDAPAVVVIDALDECAADDDIRLLVHLLSRMENVPIRLKILISSRPDLHPRLAFQEIHGAYQDAILENVAEPTICRDITLFLEHELQSIKSSYNKTVSSERQLAADWPDAAHVKALGELAVPLFIFAATTCRFISDRRNSPDRQLLEILSFHQRNTMKSARHITQLEATYMPVLNRLIAGLTTSEQNEALADFKRVIGSMVTLFTPLSSTALAQLLQVQLSAVELKLDFLHSVLDVPVNNSEPVRLMHLSFRDFLVDSGRKDAHKFQIDERYSHELLFVGCMEAMQSLRRDICAVSDPATLRLSIPKSTIDSCIPASLQYACRHWVYHLEDSETGMKHQQLVYTFLKDHLLHWLEALCLLGEAAATAELTLDLVTIFESSTDENFKALLSSTQSSLISYSDIIGKVPLQLYSSYLIFSPISSIRLHFANIILGLLEVDETGWDNFYSPATNTLNGHGTGRVLVLFSPDSLLLASASEDATIRIWSLSGRCLHLLQGHDYAVIDFCFSPDSKYIASISEDSTIRIWSVELGQCIHTRRQRCHWRSAITFSPDSNFVAIGCLDNTVKLWNIEQTSCIRVYEGAGGVPYLVAISPDARLFASCSLANDGIHIWKFSSGEYFKCLDYDEDVQSICFRGNDELLSVSANGEILAWHLSSGRYTIEKLGTTQGDRKLLCALANDQQLVAFGSRGQIEVWDLASGAFVDTIHPPNPAICSLAFHKTSRTVASGSPDAFAKITLREVDSNKLVSDLVKGIWYHCHDFIMSMSPDSTLLAAVPRYEEVQIWSTANGKGVSTIDLEMQAAVTKLEFSRDSTLIAIFSANDEVVVYELGSGACVHTFRNADRALQNPSLSADMELVAAEKFETSEIRIVRLATGEHILTVACEFITGCLGFSPDSKLLTLAGPNGDLRFWSVESRQCVFRGSLFDALSPHLADSDDLKMLREAGILNRVECSSTRSPRSIYYPSTGSPLYIYAKSLPSVRYGYGITADRCWVTWNGAKYIWLPPEARPDEFQIAEELVVLLVKRRRSRILILKFAGVPPHHRIE